MEESSSRRYHNNKEGHCSGWQDATTTLEGGRQCLVVTKESRCTPPTGYDPTTCTCVSAIDCAYTCMCDGFSLR